MTHPFQAKVREIIELLVTRRYAELERQTRGRRLSSAEIAAAIDAYGRTLINPPVGVFENLDPIRITNAVPPAWSVRVDLWTAEEGRSDLTMELTVVQNGNRYDIELDDLHVL